MSKFGSFTRRCVAGLVAGQMLLGTVSVTALAVAVPARAGDVTRIQTPETPAPQPPAPQTPAPQTPAPQTPAPQTPAPQTPAPQAPAADPMSFLTRHGDWQGFTTTVDGELVGGAMTRMDKGGIAAFMVDKNGDLELLLADPSWNLRDGMTVPVRLTIDGRTYTLTATAHGHALEMPRVTKEVLQRFASGSQARFDAGNGAVIWTLALDGFFDSMQDAVKTIEA